jgi:hypothetical protein
LSLEEVRPLDARLTEPGRIHLEGEQADAYLEILRRLIRAGLLSKNYPDPGSLDRLYRLMAPSGNLGLDPEIDLNPRNGMPSEPDIGRVLADKEAVKRFLQSNDRPDVLSRSDEASLRLQKRIHYYREVDKSVLPRRVNLTLQTIRVDQSSRTARFNAIFERYDPVEGVFTRYTIQLSHRHNRWNRPQIELNGDDLLATDSFRNVISRYSSDEAEFAYILLSDLPGIEVHEVVRARVGPLWFPESAMPVELVKLFADHPGNFILSFPLERVSEREEQAGKEAVKPDLNLDPFSLLYRIALGPELRGQADRRAAELNYRVLKERKFACTTGIFEPFKQLLSEAGAKCIIYTI